MPQKQQPQQPVYAQEAQPEVRSAGIKQSNAKLAVDGLQKLAQNKNSGSGTTNKPAQSEQKSGTAPNITVESIEEASQVIPDANKPESEIKTENKEQAIDANDLLVDKEGVNFDGYSTPDQTIRSKISHKRAVKNLHKSENQISKQLGRGHQQTAQHLPESLSLIHI